MTQTLVLFIAGGLMLLMAMVEVVNLRRTGRLTFLTAAHVLIAIGYCLPAFLLAFLPGTVWESRPVSAMGPNPWGSRLYILDLADALALPPGAYLESGLILVGGYAMLVAGYVLAHSRTTPPSLRGGTLPLPGLVAGGLVLGLIAAVALTTFASQFDGLRHMIEVGLAVRRGNATVQWGALQVLAEVAFPASLMLVAAALRSEGPRRAMLAAASAAVFAVAALRLAYAGGRLDAAMIVFTPILAWILVIRSRTLAISVLVGLGAVALFLGSIDPLFFRDPIRTLGNEFEELSTGLADNVLYMLAYLGFPHVAAAHTLTVAPGEIAFRHFADIPLGLAYMLPSFSGVETLPPMILSLHVKLLPWIPVDLFSFGYYSLGTVGVLISFAAFGALLAMFDGWLTESTGWLGQALRAAWLFYLPFRLLYADPYATLQSGFGLITGTLAIIALALWAAWRRDRPKGL